MQSLPILSIKDECIRAVATRRRVIITAPTGSGKSTQIPQLLLDASSASGKILVLQPRRLAARMLAARVAAERRCPLGTEVGYITRFDARHTEATRICFITEGILPRLLLKNPHIPDIGAIVFDEFHERSIHSDMGIGLVKNLQETHRPDLRVVVMSATIDSAELATYLGDHILLTCPQRQHPVTIRHIHATATTPIWDAAAAALSQLLAGNPEGDVLIFMPGVYEIRKTIERCKAVKSGETIRFLPLYGELASEQQDEAMATGPHRKVIVATNIAETSLTIPGVRHVIDSGLARVNRFDPGRGLNALLIEPISKDSAQQRTGRAGRLGPGVCLRLWSEKEHARRPDFHDPEIKRIDVAEVLLSLLRLGYNHPERSFPWLTPPSATAVHRAWELLQLLGAVSDRDAGLTPLGKAMAEFPAHPRLSRLLLETKARGGLAPATLIAGLLSERSIILSDAAAQERFINRFENSDSGRSKKSAPMAALHSDLFTCIRALEYARASDFDVPRCQEAGIHAGAARQAWRTADYYRQHIGTPSWESLSLTPDEGEHLIQALLMSFPDHLAKRRDFSSRVCFLRDGKRGELAPTCGHGKTELLLALELREIGQHQGTPKIQLSLVSEIAEEWLIDLFPKAWSFEHVVEWNAVKEALEKRSIDRCLGLVISEKRSEEIAPELAGKLLAKTIQEQKITLLGWNKEVNHWIARVHWVGEQFPERQLLAYDDSIVATILEELCHGKTRLTHVQEISCMPFVKNRLSFADQEFIGAMAPESIGLPSGRSLKIKYRPGQPPKSNAKIQDLYGLTATPMVAGGRQKILLEILGPNFRPVQVTDDLAGFWQNLYPKIKKELMRRYPKHEWR